MENGPLRGPPPAGLPAYRLTVLNLVLMEYGLRGHLGGLRTSQGQVLILVLMEYGLRVYFLRR